MNANNPSAIVTVNGSEKKIYDNNQIFLNPDDNFEIRFFNPLSEKLGIEIIFNGQKKTNSLLVLNPGEDITIDRFIDDNEKMKFSTYFVDSGNAAAVEAIKSNGSVQINFFKEKINNFGWESMQGSLGNNIVTDNFTTISSTDPKFLYNMYDTRVEKLSHNKDFPFITTSYSSDPSQISSYCSDNTEKNIDVKLEETKLETGRVEKGGKSDQVFEQVNLDFESTPFHSISYDMKPLSTKPVNMSEIKRYCTSCGYRIRKTSWKYCPKCSSEI